VLVGSVAKAPVRVNDNRQTIRELLGTSRTVAVIPHSHVVEQDSTVIQEPHFHEIDQYQMVVGGSGRIGAKPLSVGGYHYTDRATTYGPIIGGAEGLHYLVMRPLGEPGVDISGKFMPQSRHLRSRRPGRHIYGDATAPLADGPRGEWVLASDLQDGGIVTSVAVPAAAQVPEPARRDQCGPGYAVALEGSFTMNGETLDPPSVIWMEVTDQWPQITAGQDGGTIIWLTFSRAHAKA
jgi:hypothetical protein